MHGFRGDGMGMCRHVVRQYQDPRLAAAHESRVTV
jgi:hypothetical protein